MTEKEIVKNCLNRIKEKYVRKGQLDAWTDTTREEFLRAFSLAPITLLTAIVDELLLNPPTDDRGRVANYLPDPADIVSIAKRLRSEALRSPSDVVREIMGSIAQFGRYGATDPKNKNVTYEGAPPLSPLAENVVASMGGWLTLCEMDAKSAVINGLLLKHASDAVTEDKNKPILVSKKGHESLSSLSSLLPRLEPTDA